MIDRTNTVDITSTDIRWNILPILIFVSILHHLGLDFDVRRVRVLHAPLEAYTIILAERRLGFDHA